MPGLEHEAAVELLRRNPELTAALLASAGVPVPAGAAAVVTDSNLSLPEPTELRADLVTLYPGTGGSLAIVTEVQKDPPDKKKRRAWPAYVAVARVEHECDAALVVIALRSDTARASARPIATGHPGFVLRPIVIGPDNTPAAEGPHAAELAVLAVLTGALDLGDPAAQLLTLQHIARADAERRQTYTRLIRLTAAEAVRQALEELMTTVFPRDDFIDGLLDQGRAEGLDQGRAEGLDQGRAEGEAKMLLRVLAARGFAVPDEIRERVTGCTDTGQLEAWADRAITASSITEIFSD
jgi:hypothetical protein